MAAENILIGADCAISWNTQIMDSDSHKIFSGGERTNPNKSIVIGNRVWIASRVIISKGAEIPEG